MSSYGDATAAMLRAAEASSEAAEIVRGLARERGLETATLERVARRLENGAAQAELDRRLVDELARGAILEP